MTDDSYKCGRCLVTYEVREPSERGAERLRCPDCGLVFASGASERKGIPLATMSITADELERRKGKAA